MPKIPKGNFDVAPSLDVPSARVPQIEAFGTQALRTMGKQGLAIGKQWSKAQGKVQALTGIADFEQEVNGLEDEVKSLANNTTGGMIPSSKAGEKGKELSAAVGEKIETYRQAHLAKMGDNPEQMEMYNTLIAPRLQNLQNKALREQVSQQRNHTDTLLNDKMTAINMKAMMGEDYKEDLHAFNTMAEKSIGIFSKEEVAGKSAKLQKLLAFGAAESISYKGWSPEAEAQAKRTIAGTNLTEGERLAANYKLSKAIDTGKAVTRRKVNAEFTQVVNNAKDIQSYLVNRDMFQKTLSTMQTLGKAEWETDQEHAAKIDTLVSTMAVNEVAIKNRGELYGNPQQVQTEVQTAAGTGVESRMETADEADYRKRQELFKDAMDIKNKLLGGNRGIASSSIDATIAKKINEMRTSMKSKGGSLKMHTQFDSMFVSDMNSGDEDRREAAITRYMEFGKNNQVPAHNMTIVTLDESEAYGKTLKQLKAGDADPTGMHQLGLIREIKKKYGDKWSGKAIEDIITFGGGTQAGKTNVPASWALINYINDDTVAAEILSAQNRLDENKAGMMESSEFKELDNSIRNNTMISRLRHGQLSDNDQVANGFHESVKALAVSYMTGDTSLSADDAVKKAQDKIFSKVAWHSDGDNVNMMIPSESLSKAGYDKDDLAEATSNMKDFRSLQTIGPEIAWDKMAGGNGSSRLAASLKDIASKGTPAEQYARAQQLLGDSIMIVNDGKNPNNVSMYIRTSDSPPIPVIVKSDTGYRKFNIDMIEAIGKSKEYETEQDARSNFGEFVQSIGDFVSIDQETLDRQAANRPRPIGQTPNAMRASKKTLKTLDDIFIGDVEKALKTKANPEVQYPPIGQAGGPKQGPLDFITEKLTGRKLPTNKKKKKK